MQATAEGVDEPRVSAETGGVAAGRDVNFEDHRRMEFLQLFLGSMDSSPPPKADSPHLSDCPHCGRKWLSRYALFCPTCGYSVQLARQTRKRRADLQDAFGTFSLYSTAGVAYVGVLALLGHPVSRDDIAFGLICGVLAALLGLLWAGVRWGRKEEF